MYWEGVRGGTFYWFSRDFAGTPKDPYEALMQEHRAWAHIGATRYDASAEIAQAEEDVRRMVEKHGSCDASQWKWGDGAPCKDVFEADEAKRTCEDLSDKLSVLTAFRDESRHDVPVEFSDRFSLDGVFSFVVFGDVFVLLGVGVIVVVIAGGLMLDGFFGSLVD